MLIGSAVHTIDAKGRVVIPAKYRESLGLSVVAVKSVDGCIRVYPRVRYEEYLEKLSKGNVLQLKMRRKLVRNAEELTLDSQGRVLLSEDMRGIAGITDKVRMVGMIDWLEFWNEEKFEQECADEEFTPEELQQMAELGLC